MHVQPVISVSYTSRSGRAGLRCLDPLLEQRFDFVIPKADIGCLSAGRARLSRWRCLVSLGGRFHHDELLVLFVVAVGAFRPEAARLQREDARERDATDEVVGGQLERRIAQGARDRVLQLVRG